MVTMDEIRLTEDDPPTEWSFEGFDDNYSAFGPGGRVTLLESLDGDEFVVSGEETVEGGLDDATRIVQSVEELDTRTEHADEAMEAFRSFAESLSNEG